MGMSPMTPPPDMQGGGGDQSSTPPTQPIAASPSPAQPSQALQAGVQSVIRVTTELRGLAKAYPAAAGEISKIMDNMQKIQGLIMQNQSPGEPQAPPTAG